MTKNYTFPIHVFRILIMLSIIPAVVWSFEGKTVGTHPVSGQNFTRTVILGTGGNTIYVNKNVANGNGSGDSWTNAFTELADALKWAKENESNWSAEHPLKIFVARGIYKPKYSPTDGNFGIDAGKDNAFMMVKNVEIYGGFAGTEVTLADRDLSLTANATILSSDVNGNDVVSGSGNSLDINNTDDNNFHVVVAVGDLENALLDGFTVTGGNANSTGSYNVNNKGIYKNRGGGIYCRFSSPYFRNLIITGNIATAFGGGVYNDDQANPIFVNTLVTNNISEKGGAFVATLLIPRKLM